MTKTLTLISITVSTGSPSTRRKMIKPLPSTNIVVSKHECKALECLANRRKQNRNLDKYCTFNLAKNIINSNMC